MTINGWSESKDDAALRWEKTQAVWYAAEQLKASEITEIEAIELEAALRNASLLDTETVTDLVRAAYMEASEPRVVHTLQELADMQARQFNRRYYGNKDGKPEWQTGVTGSQG